MKHPYAVAAVVTLISAMGASAGPPTVDHYGDPLPDGVVARLGTERFRSPYRSLIAILPDGKAWREAHGGSGLTIRDYDVADGQLKRNVLMSTEALTLAGLSRDGRVILTRTAKDVLDVWDAESGKRTRTFQLPAQVRVFLIHAALSPNGKYLATVYRTDTYQLHLWNVADGEGRPVGPPAKFYYPPCFTHDGTRLIASDHRTLRCWSTETGVESWNIAEGLIPVRAIAPENRLLLAMSTREDRGMHCVDIRDGKLIREPKFPHVFPFVCGEFGEDQLTMIFGNREGTGFLWDLKSGKRRATFAGLINIVAVSPDRKWFLGAYVGDTTLQRWETATGRALWPDTRERGHSAGIYYLSFSANGNRLVSGAADRSVKVWELADQRLVATLDHSDWIGWPVLTPDGRFVVAATQDRLTQWKANTGRRIRSFEPPGNVSSIGWEHVVVEQSTLHAILHIDPFSASDRPLVVEWDLQSGREKTRYLGRPNSSRETLLSGGIYVGYPGKVIDAVTAREQATFELPKGLSLAIGEFRPSREGQLVACRLLDYDAGLVPRELAIWETSTGRIVTRLGTEAGNCALSANGRFVASADAGGMRVWDVLTGEVLYEQTAPRRMWADSSSCWVGAMAFSSDCRTLATAHPDGTILIWDLTAVRKPQPRELAEAALMAAWNQLSDSDPKAGLKAAWELTDSPARTVPFLQARLKPVAPVPAERLKTLIADLDNSEFLKRQAASKALSELGEQAVSALRDTLKAGPSAEAERRIEQLLSGKLPLSPEQLRTARTIGILERIATREAQALLTELSKGDPAARLTRLAKAASARTQSR